MLTETSDGLFRRKEDCRHAAQLLFDESQKSPLVWTICQFGSNIPSFFLFLLDITVRKCAYKKCKMEKNRAQPLILDLPAAPLRHPPSLFDIIVRGKLLIVMVNWSMQQYRQRYGIIGGCAGQLKSPTAVNVSGICEAKSPWACGSRWLSDWALSVWACGQPKQVNPHPHHH